MFLVLLFIVKPLARLNIFNISMTQSLIELDLFSLHAEKEARMVKDTGLVARSRLKLTPDKTVEN